MAERKTGSSYHACLKEPRVRKAREVRVEKPGAVRFSSLLGVEIEREEKEMPKSDYANAVLVKLINWVFALQYASE